MPRHLEANVTNRASVTGAVQPVQHAFSAGGSERVAQSRLVEAVWHGLDRISGLYELQRLHDGHPDPRSLAASSVALSESPDKAVRR